MQNKKNKKLIENRFLGKRAGFTFVELMVVMSIIFIISAVVLVGLGSMRNSSQLDSSQREVAAAIKLLQSYAIQGKTQDIGGVQKAPCGYGFQFTSNNGFQIFYNKPLATVDCQTMDATSDANNYKFNANSVVLESFTLGQNVALSFPTIDMSGIYFSTPNAKIYHPTGSLFSAGDTKTYTLKYQNKDPGKSITINSVGAIIED